MSGFNLVLYIICLICLINAFFIILMCMLVNGFYTSRYKCVFISIMVLDIIKHIILLYFPLCSYVLNALENHHFKWKELYACIFN